MPMLRILLLASLALGFSVVSGQYQAAPYGPWNPTVRTPYTWSDDEIKILKELCYSWLDQNVLTYSRPTLAIRLWFHDCIGACDGCINLNDPSNAGLPAFVADIGSFWNSLFPSFFGKYMSNADFWYLMALVAIQYTIDVTSVFCGQSDCAMPNMYFRFPYGRLDCATTPGNNLNEGVPSGMMTYNQMMSWYAAKFQLSPAQVTALMGCHTVGRMHLQYSGFDGAWKEGINSIPFYLMYDNTYYALLSQTKFGQLNLYWNQYKTAAGNWMWKGVFSPTNVTCSSMMHIDLCMAWNFTTDAYGKASCTPPNCPTSPTYQLVQSYAQNKTWWAQDAICVIEKVAINNVNTNYLAMPTPGSSTCAGLNYDFRFPLPVVSCYP